MERKKYTFLIFQIEESPNLDLGPIFLILSVLLVGFLFVKAVDVYSDITLPVIQWVIPALYALSLFINDRTPKFHFFHALMLSLLFFLQMAFILGIQSDIYVEKNIAFPLVSTLKYRMEYSVENKPFWMLLLFAGYVPLIPAFAAGMIDAPLAVQRRVDTTAQYTVFLLGTFLLSILCMYYELFKDGTFGPFLGIFGVLLMIIAFGVAVYLPLILIQRLFYKICKAIS